MKPGKNTRHINADGFCYAHWQPQFDQPHEDQSQLDVLNSPTGLLPSCMPYLAARAGGRDCEQCSMRWNGYMRGSLTDKPVIPDEPMKQVSMQSYQVLYVRDLSAADALHKNR